MRVLHMLPRISPRSGSPYNLLALVRGLADCGVEITLVTSHGAKDGELDLPLHQPVLCDGVTYIVHRVWPLGERWGFAPSMIRTFARLVAAHDLVHIHWLYGFAEVAAARAARAAGVPFVLQPHGSLDPHVRGENALLKSLYLTSAGRLLLGGAAAVIFAAEQERLVAAYNRRRPEWIVPAGIDGAAFSRLPPRGAFRAAFPHLAGPFVLFLGRLSAQKGLDLLLPAFERVARNRDGLQLVIAGPDYRGYEAVARKLAIRLGIAERVHFTGLLTHELKLAAYVDAELFVLPSYWENFGVVLIEALACGLPVVISDRVNIHRELAAAGAAIVVQCTPESVAAGIDMALDDGALRERVAATGPALVRGQYTWEAIAPRLAQQYADVLASAQLRSPDRCTTYAGSGRVEP